MSANYPSHYTMQFSSNVELLLQQKGSKLRGKVTEAGYTGKAASPVNQVGSIEMQRVTSRFAPRVRTDASVDRRWVYPVDYDLAQMIDSFDKLKSIVDLKSPETMAAVNAAGRAIDREIISAFFGTAKTGEQGATSTTFPSANQVTVSIGGTNSVINVQKLIKAKEILMTNFVDFDQDEVFVGITAKDNTGLLNEVQIISSDFNGGDKPVLKDGKVTSFLGFTFVHCELLEANSTGTNKVRLPVWAKSGMHLGLWWDPSPTISQRTDLQGDPWQVALNKSFGATRIEEGKILEIESYRA